jgi:hypothetical protein
LLSDMPPVAMLANIERLYLLPPSRGVMLMRTPPVASSAEAPDVSIDTSCIAAMLIGPDD